MLRVKTASERIAFICLALGFFSAILGFFLYGVERGLTEKDAKVLHAWLALISSNWPEQGALDRQTPSFSVGMVLLVLLSIAPLVGIFATWGKLVALERSRLMRYIDIISARDALIMREIMNQVEADQHAQLIPKLLEAFKQADSKFYSEQLPSLVEPSLLNRVRNELFEHIVSHA